MILECGARVDLTNNAGSAVLMNAVENEDVDGMSMTPGLIKVVFVVSSTQSAAMKSAL